MKRKFLFVLAFIAGPLCGAALAQEKVHHAEASIGWSKFSLDNGPFVRRGLTVNSTSTNPMGYGIRYGRNLAGIWGFQMALVDAGYLRVRGVDAAGLPWTTNIHATNWSLVGTATHSLNEKLAVFGRFGGLAYENNFGKSVTVQRVLDDQERGVGLTYGAGLTLRIHERWSLSANVDRFDGSHKTTVLSGGLRFGF